MTSFKVKVNYIGIIKSQSGKRSEEIAITSERTIQDLLLTLGFSEAQQKFIFVTDKEMERHASELLTPNMEISLFLPSGGG